MTLKSNLQASKIGRRLAATLLVASSAMAANTATAENYYGYYSSEREYEVTITNITRGQTFTPQLVVTHSRSVSLFQVGQPASEQMEILAEAGDTAPATELLGSLGDKVGDVQTIGGLLAPGKSATIKVSAGRKQRYLSVAAMLIPTNDTFVALNTVRLPVWGQYSRTVPAYDAGTEANDQNCANMPGPRCGGAGSSPGPNEGDEGYVYISNGFHEKGSKDAAGNEILGPMVYDWRNPVAQITVKRVR